MQKRPFTTHGQYTVVLGVLVITLGAIDSNDAALIQTGPKPQKELSLFGLVTENDLPKHAV